MVGVWKKPMKGETMTKDNTEDKQGMLSVADSAILAAGQQYRAPFLISFKVTLEKEVLVVELQGTERA